MSIRELIAKAERQGVETFQEDEGATISFRFGGKTRAVWSVEFETFSVLRGGSKWCVSPREAWENLQAMIPGATP